MKLSTQYLGTLINLDIFAKTTVGPITMDINNPDGTAWEATENDVLRYWIKKNPDDADNAALLNKVVNWTDLTTATFSFTITAVESAIAVGNYHHQLILTIGADAYVLFFGRINIRDRLDA